MSELIEIKVPDLGGSSEVDVVEILVQPGDTIVTEQTLVVLESDKATMDMPSTTAGTVRELKIKVGDKVSQGVTIATVEISESSANEAAPEPESVAEEEAEQDTAPEAKPVTSATPAAAASPAPAPAAPIDNEPSGQHLPHATPATRLFARELGVDLSLIKQGSGRKGRILKEDVKAYVKQTLSEGIKSSGAGIPPIPAVDFSQFGETEVLPLSKIKRLTGQNMTRVWLNLPLVTHHDEADITELEAFRKQINAENSQNAKVTGLIFIIKALANALKQFPNFNASLSPDGASLILKKYCHIGIAVDTPNGLVVPVLRDVDRKSIYELSAELATLSEKARAGKLMPNEMQGGSMTISSLGGIGGTAFTPIVNAPEVAILGVTRAKMQPVWDGKEFQPRLMLPLDMTYDHRVIDGAEAARFMVKLTDFLTDIRRLIL
ncbi:dihydrolipoyllysine-residue acetyltransferase [Methylotuvimicrobium buryatense]|uniref:Acetyltransferase component of pyruvate dehydrogenase complex n=1 Tax=Methylotuvimicrobium buryatense TaxID=95641 RepID=A0A4P9UL90_METBY|nr:dihydrolipoyllysine-residue acetyltransferase [Methylotuvimicrobium buryatense]QCW81867.1 dihydrolipoyllysine-residue acetyltransferase [Methylotuvimicrobium buryatense]